MKYFTGWLRPESVSLHPEKERNIWQISGSEGWEQSHAEMIFYYSSHIYMLLVHSCSLCAAQVTEKQENHLSRNINHQILLFSFVFSQIRPIKQGCGCISSFLLTLTLSWLQINIDVMGGGQTVSDPLKSNLVWILPAGDTRLSPHFQTLTGERSHQWGMWKQLLKTTN